MCHTVDGHVSPSVLGRVSILGTMGRLSRVIGAACLAIVAAMPAHSEAARAPLHPTTLRPELVGDARQLLIVVPTRWTSTTATMDRWELRQGSWVRMNRSSYTARVGRSGTRVVRAEGDGSTPAGSFGLISALGRETRASTRLPYTRIRQGNCWISDVSDPDYNRFVTRSRCGKANEDLYRIMRAGPYRRVVVTDYNTSPIVAGRGSAIFVHLHARRAGRTVPTSGCVSIDAAPMNATWRWLDPGMAPRIVIGTTRWLTGS